MTRMLPLYIVTGAVGITSFYLGLTGKKFLFVTDTRMAVIVLAVVGFLMCCFGSIGVFVNKAPGHPLTAAGYVLGVLAMLTAAVQIFKLNVIILNNPRYALIVIGVIIAIKFIIARLAFLLPVK